MRTEISSTKELPGIHLLGHTCTNLNGDLLLVWGGTNEAVAFSSTPNTDLWIYETLTGYWRHKICTGECPPYLSSCSSCLIGQKMYIFGGHSTVQDNWLNCLYCLDLNTFIWRDVGSQARAEPTKPIRSDKNVCWSYEKKLYVFGGYGWSQVEHYSELLDCQKDLQLTPDFRWPKFGWNNQLVEYNPLDKTWRWPRYSGKCPSARAAFSGALMGDKYFVFGGRDSQERLNDLYTLNMKTLEWQQIAVVATPNTGPNTSTLAIRGTGPIGHLGEGGPSSRNTDEEEEEEDDDHMDSLADENHRQIVEEMHDVQVEEDDDERWNSVASSSNEQQVNISENTIEQDGDQEERNEEENFEYPHPSHLLERWSLSSSSTNHQTANTDGEHSPGANNYLDCLFGAQSDFHTTNNPTSATQTSNNNQAQNLFSASNGGLRAVTDHLHAAQNGADATQQEQQSAQQQNQDQIHYHELDRPQQEPQGQQQQQVQPRDDDEPPLQVELADDRINDNDGMRDDERPDDTINTIPTGRSFCSLTPISSSDMLLFGGVDSHDQNLDDCWLFNIDTNHWSQINDFKHRQPRLWHTGAKTKQNEVVIMGGSSSEKIDEFCSDVFVISFEAKSLKRLALDAVSRSVRMKTIQRTKGLPSTLIKLIKLRKQAMALTMRRSASQRSLPAVVVQQ